MNCRDQEEVARSRKFALNRETLRTTGTGKPGIIFRQREFATIPPHHPFSWLQRIILRAPSMRFLRKGGIYRSDVVPNQSQNQILGRDRTASAGRPRAQAKERVGRTTPFSSSAMSSAPAIP